MNIELTTLIVNQAKTFGVMFAAGIFTESLWQIKKFLQNRTCFGCSNKMWERAVNFFEEAAFWLVAAAALSAFLYYCAYGKISVHAAAGFFIGLILWKKIWHYVILNPWGENDEAQNLKTTARSSTWTRQGGSANRKGKRKKKKSKKKSAMLPAREREGKWLSGEAATEDDS